MLTGVKRFGAAAGKRTGIRGFTLIELLVVIAIIALLLAIVLPALRTAKLIARQVVCSAQMKQWALGVHLYANDNDETLPPYCNTNNGTGGPVDLETWWFNRLATYVAEYGDGFDYETKWGLFKTRKCPMGKGGWGDEACWIGVFRGRYNPKHGAFVYYNLLTNGQVNHMSDPVKRNTIRTPSEYMMLLDVRRDYVFNPFFYNWRFDRDGDGMNDSHIDTTDKWLYNWARPKVHRGGCNVALFDGHVEGVKYEDLWELGANGYPVHRYWYNGWRP